MTKYAFPTTSKQIPSPTRSSYIDYFTSILIITTILILFSLLFFITKNLWSYSSSGQERIRVHKKDLSMARNKLLKDYILQYNKFLQRNNRNYSNKERNLRFTYFLKNVMRLEEQVANDGQTSSNFKLTCFADWSEEEFKNILLPMESEEDSTNAFPEMSEKVLQMYENATLPGYINWRRRGKVTPIKDQNVPQPCASCYAFSSVAAVESQHAIQNNLYLNLSEQQIVDCDMNSFGCQLGFSSKAMEYIMENGLYPEKYYPYKAVDHNHTECKRFPVQKLKIREYGKLLPNETLIASWVANHGPLTFGMRVTIELAFYQGGVFSPSEDDCIHRRLGRHAMTIIGYGRENGRDYWLIKNSYGKNWGLNGYMKLARGVNACKMAENVLVPFVDKIK